MRLLNALIKSGSFAGWIAVAQQALADQKCARAGRVETADILGRADSALRDDQRIATIVREQILGHRQIGHEGMQVAIVDSDQFSADARRESELLGVVNFDERGHFDFARQRRKRTQFALFQHRDNQQDAVGARRARFINLVRMENKILAQQRKIDRRAHRAQIIERAFEMAIGQHRNRRRAASPGIGARPPLDRGPAGYRPCSVRRV